MVGSLAGRWGLSYKQLKVGFDSHPYHQFRKYDFTSDNVEAFIDGHQEGGTCYEG